MKKYQLIQIIKEEIQRAILEDNKILIPRRLEGRIEKKIQDYIKNGCVGNLDLSGAQITELPPNLKKVGGSLWLTRSEITKLPDDLEVEDGLDLSYTAIVELPKRLKVGGSIVVDNTPLSKKHSADQIRKMIQDLGGTVRGRILI